MGSMGQHSLLHSPKGGTHKALTRSKGNHPHWSPGGGVRDPHTDRLTSNEPFKWSMDNERGMCLWQEMQESAWLEDPSSQDGEQMVQRTGETPGVTQEEPSWEELHSTWNLCAPEAPGQSKSEQWQIKWLPASKLKAWHQFDEDVMHNSQSGCGQKVEMYYNSTGILEHILSWWLKALSEGCYPWCHDQVLKTAVETICSAITHFKQ